MLHPKVNTNSLFAMVCASSPVFRQILKQQKTMALPIPKHVLAKAGIVE